MADQMKNDSNNQTMQHEKAKASVGGERQNEQGLDKNRQEKSAIGGSARESDSARGQSGQNQPTGQSDNARTGEPGRARSELDESRKQPS